MSQTTRYSDPRDIIKKGQDVLPYLSAFRSLGLRDHQLTHGGIQTEPGREDVDVDLRGFFFDFRAAPSSSEELKSSSEDSFPAFLAYHCWYLAGLGAQKRIALGFSQLPIEQNGTISFGRGLMKFARGVAESVRRSVREGSGSSSSALPVKDGISPPSEHRVLSRCRFFFSLSLSRDSTFPSTPLALHALTLCSVFVRGRQHVIALSLSLRIIPDQVPEGEKLCKWTDTHHRKTLTHQILFGTKTFPHKSRKSLLVVAHINEVRRALRLLQW